MNYIVQGVILVYFVGMFALGILGEQRTKNTADYYVAGRQVNGFFSGFVYMTSLVSAGALVGWVSQTWQWGVYFIYAGSAVTVATFLLLLVYVIFPEGVAVALIVVVAPFLIAADVFASFREGFFT